ncbi:MAG TPA: hypothetical protein DCQ28_09985 [Bacteroidetes bacterium]|jgi:hypothetical protein|nr:hypothetical protein [Bacteroidota bacterium]
MAKQQSFEEKAKKAAKAGALEKTIKFVAAVKTDKGSYRFNQKLVKIKDEKSEEAVLEAEFKKMQSTAH